MHSVINSCLCTFGLTVVDFDECADHYATCISYCSYILKVSNTYYLDIKQELSFARKEQMEDNYGCYILIPTSVMDKI